MLVWVIPFKKTGTFAIAYVFAIISIFAFAASYFFAFDKTKTLKSKFLSFPIFRIGFYYLVVQLSLSTLFMILTSFMNVHRWVAITPCVLVLAFAIIKTMTIDIARDKMEDIAIKQEINTSFVRTLQIDLETLSERAKDAGLKERLSKLAESVRFSDPVSNAAVAETEEKMTVVFDSLKTTVYSGRVDVDVQIDELTNLLSERNKKCRISKPK
jgi:hypothetical protein